MTVLTSYESVVSSAADTPKDIDGLRLASAPVLGGRPRKPKLAVVSTFDDLCGIAGYTRALLLQLEPYFDVEVFDLDQFFMRSLNRKVRKLADAMVQDFCATAGKYDCVNIQLEHGTLGRDITDISRRFGMIARSARALSVTFHTVLPQENFPFGRFAGSLARLRLGLASDLVLNFAGSKVMNYRMYRLLRRLQEKKPVSVIVHTRREKRLMRYVNGIQSVYDHPLAFMAPETAKAYRAQARSRRIPGLGELPAGSKLIGVFGFLSEYKGVDTVIQAMHKLPENYHLLVFGGLHPNEIKQGVPLNPYVKRLLGEGYVGASLIEGLGSKAAVTLHLDGSSRDMLTGHPKDIGDRIHFLGPQTDEDFAANMAICDHVVLPYLEVGQSASGVASIALEMGCRVIAARNHAFMQFTRYHPYAFELFEIGNFLELAEKIRAEPAYPAGARTTTYSVASNAQVYVAANTPPWAQRVADEAVRSDAVSSDAATQHG